MAWSGAPVGMVGGGRKGHKVVQLDVGESQSLADGKLGTGLAAKDRAKHQAKDKHQQPEAGQSAADAERRRQAEQAGPLTSSEAAAGSSGRNSNKGKQHATNKQARNNSHKSQAAAAAATRRAHAPASDTSFDRLQREVLGQGLWRDAPGATLDQLQELPVRFNSLAAYTAAFEPLLLEEAREQLRQAYHESSDAQRSIAVTITRVDSDGQGWYTVTVSTTRHKGLFANTVAVLTACGLHASKAEQKDAVCVAGQVTHVDRNDEGSTAKVRFPLPIDDVGEYGKRLLESMQKQPSLQWHATPAGALTTARREFATLYALRENKGASWVLQPEKNLCPTIEGSEPPPLPPNLTDNFAGHLAKVFDAPQRIAISSVVQATLGDKKAGLVLVQGPPGTGKTHTVWGLLNVIHLTFYQRYYASLLTKLAPNASEGSGQPETEDDAGGPEGEELDDLLKRMDSSLGRLLPKLVPKPKILVCTPSNAAIDELLARVMSKGFIDGELRTYYPMIARVVSAETQVSAYAKEVSVEEQMRRLVSTPGDQRYRRARELQHLESSIMHQITLIRRELDKIASTKSNQSMAELDPEDLQAVDAARDSRLQKLAEMQEQRDKVLVELGRLQLIEEHSRLSSSRMKLEADLEKSYVDEAELVFTTLSSSGRAVFSRIARKFDVVIIDEAAQAGELATLQPLLLGKGAAVMVGDPQQLPATVVSRAAASLQYQRSFFERVMMAGCRPLLLSVQYRMHPEIRSFPSRYFYENLLQDAPSVLARGPDQFHQHPLLRPYSFIDVAGKETRNGRGSLQNEREALVAAKLYHLLSDHIPKESIHQRCSVITPYRQQQHCLRRAFEKELSSEEAARVHISTVDSYQGQECDVIIFSCVRASAKGGVGFVADTRRLNVALTRARRSLWVLGSAKSLMQVPVWDALVQDAHERGCFVSSATVVSTLGLQPSPESPRPRKRHHNGQAGPSARRFRGHAHNGSRDQHVSREDHAGTNSNRAATQSRKRLLTAKEVNEMHRDQLKHGPSTSAGLEDGEIDED
eukprot:jgi/Chlat1/7284/Chrsp58S06911